VQSKLIDRTIYYLVGNIVFLTNDCASAWDCSQRSPLNGPLTSEFPELGNENCLEAAFSHTGTWEFVVSFRWAKSPGKSEQFIILCSFDTLPIPGIG
jgi:hypothetical protein